jgi:hypothetical protein
MLPDPVILRRELHMHPELSGEEQGDCPKNSWAGCMNGEAAGSYRGSVDMVWQRFTKAVSPVRPCSFAQNWMPFPLLKKMISPIALE